MKQTVCVLGIETSCDETAAAVLQRKGGVSTVLADIIHAQTDDHAPYGGVVPEIAARAHVELADQAVKAAVDQSGIGLDDFDAVAATSGPGLIGGVMVGMMTGKALSLAAGKPFLPINHLEGHALSPRIGADCPFPYLLLLASGGHCQFLLVRGLGDYQRLGTTIDDAAGEAFDKLAKTIGLGFPGGPAVEACAVQGDPNRYDLPRPLLNRPGLDLSFAGLKTAAARIAAAGPLNDQDRADLCAAYQAAICDCLAEKTRRAIEQVRDQLGGELRLVVAGGVAANMSLRDALERVAANAGAKLVTPPLRHCTDNAVMIAQAGAERVLAGLVPDDGLSFAARPRWPLDMLAAQNDPAYGAGKRGAKA
ncbi:MAG: tRNA (adenosine(37)-N6)-threonylcarbamoyltransferase complex transferase subunit TsaD [Pseudomonadota bacterium]